MEGERPYLREAGFQDYKESIRAISFEEIRERVSNAEEMMAMIEERERQADRLVGQEFKLSLESGKEPDAETEPGLEPGEAPSTETEAEPSLKPGPEPEPGEAPSTETEAEPSLKPGPELEPGPGPESVSDEEKDREAEPQKAEVAILERIPSTHSGYDFYIARRQRPGRVFEPETVIVGKARGKIYLARYKGEDEDSFEAIDEDRFLEQAVNPESFAGKPYHSIATIDRLAVLGLNRSGEMLDSGGEARVYPIMYRRQEKILPQAGVRKEPIIESRLVEEKESVAALGGLLDRFPEQPGAEYLVRPIGEADIDDKRNILYEMAETEEGVANNLAQEIESGEHRLNAEQRLTIILQLFKTLKYLSDRGFRHNDVKPRNILLTKHGIRLCDYGLLTFRKDEVKEEHRNRVRHLPNRINTARFDNEYTIIGTVPYLHPRASTENPLKYGNTDTYGAAVTAYSLLTGRNPREEIPQGRSEVFSYLQNFEEFRAALCQHLDQALAGPEYQDLDQEKTARLAELIKSGFEPSKEKRFPGPEEYIEALEGLGIGESLDIDAWRAFEKDVDQEADTAEWPAPPPDPGNG